MRQRCQTAPGRLAAIASTSPAWASEVTSFTPARPRATRSAKNTFQASLVSLVATFTPRTSRWPSALTPVATSTTALTTRPTSRTFIVNASAATNVNGPASPSGRVRNAVTCCVEVGGHPRDLRLRQRGDPQALDELVHPPGRDAQQVAGRDHADQRRLGPLAALEQPFREVGARAQLRDRHVDRAGPGVQLPVPVPVAGVHPLRAGQAVLGAADSVRVRAEQGVDHRRQQRAHQIRRRVGQRLAQQPGRVNHVWCGHRVDVLSRVL